jgi:hypothetical protein
VPITKAIGSKKVAPAVLLTAKPIINGTITTIYLAINKIVDRNINFPFPIFSLPKPKIKSFESLDKKIQTAGIQIVINKENSTAIFLHAKLTINPATNATAIIMLDTIQERK